MRYRSMTVTAAVFTAVMAVAGESAAPIKINFSNGFADVTGLAFNGAAALSQPDLCLTVGERMGQAGSVFSKTAVPVRTFKTSFQFFIQDGDGITFTLQREGPNAPGNRGSGLGYAGISQSVAVKFDNFDDDEQGYGDLTGLYSGGEEPTGGLEALTSPMQIDGGLVSVNMTYNGTDLTVRMSDKSGARFAQTYAIDIPRTLGGSTAFVGFTGSTGAVAGSQCVVGWTYAAQ